MNSSKFVIAALIGATVLAIALIARPERASSAADEAEEGITVVALGTVKATPDRAELTFTVTTEGATSKDALAANTARSNRLIAALKAAGIPDADIQTRHVAVSPRYSERGKELREFTAENTVTVDVDSRRAGAIVDLAVANGANNVYGPTFDRTDREARYREALELAMRAAREKAEAIGAAGNVPVGDVIKVVEGTEVDDGPVHFAALAERAAATPVEPGTEKIQATLTVTFAVPKA